MIRTERPTAITHGIIRAESLQLGLDPKAPNIARHIMRLFRLPEGGLRVTLQDPRSGSWEDEHGAWHEQSYLRINGIGYRVTAAREAGNHLQGRRVEFDIEEALCPPKS